MLMNIIEYLKNLQAVQGLNNSDFGKLYGISETYWSHLKNGTKTPGINFLGLVLNRHKNDFEARHAVIEFLMDRCKLFHNSRV